jgi:transposase
LRAEIERESVRLVLVKQQVKAQEAARRQELADGKQPLVPWQLFERRHGSPHA